MRYVAILCWTIGAGALAGAIAAAVHGNVGGTIGLIVFGAVWAGFGFLMRFISTAETGAATGPIAPAEEPPWWLERADWAEGKIRQDVTASSRGFMIGALVMTALGLAGVLASLLAGWQPGAFGYLVLAFGVFMLVVGVRARIRLRKFGVSVVECQTMPARLGGRFQGTVQTGVPLQGQPQRTFRVRLSCEQRTTSGTGSSRKTRTETLWKHEETVRGVISSAGPTFQVPLDLAIPDNLPPTSPRMFEDRTFWTLRVGTETEGVDYAAGFEVPVGRPLAVPAPGAVTG
jgi:hypothetical protein